MTPDAVESSAKTMVALLRRVGAQEERR